MNKYKIFSPSAKGSFGARLEELNKQVSDYLDKEKPSGSLLHYSKVFLSDIQNQYGELIGSLLYGTLSTAPLTVVEQPPLNGSKITVLLMTAEDDCQFHFDSFRLTDEEAAGCDSYHQTRMLYDKYLDSIAGSRLDIRTHLVRTWIYVSDIDVNYAGVVKARNDVFAQHGLTAGTHFIASTGIGGNSEAVKASVAMDFLTYPGIEEGDKKYLKALEYLNPTHEYGVAFERGTRVKTADGYSYYISGTASIDKRGQVLYIGDVISQTNRLLENIGALLKDGGATMSDIGYFIIYLRDMSDYAAVETLMDSAYPDTPHVIVEARVCRPQWLIEMECVAHKAL